MADREYRGQSGGSHYCVSDLKFFAFYFYIGFLNMGFKGKMVNSLYYRRLSLPPSDFCAESYLEIREFNASGPLIGRLGLLFIALSFSSFCVGRFCGTYPPKIEVRFYCFFYIAKGLDYCKNQSSKKYSFVHDN